MIECDDVTISGSWLDVKDSLSPSLTFKYMWPLYVLFFSTTFLLLVWVFYKKYSKFNRRTRMVLCVLISSVTAMTIPAVLTMRKKFEPINCHIQKIFHHLENIQPLDALKVRTMLDKLEKQFNLNMDMVLDRQTSGIRYIDTLKQMINSATNTMKKINEDYLKSSQVMINGESVNTPMPALEMHHKGLLNLVFDSIKKEYNLVPLQKIQESLSDLYLPLLELVNITRFNTRLEDIITAATKLKSDSSLFMRRYLYTNNFCTYMLIVQTILLFSILVIHFKVFSQRLCRIKAVTAVAVGCSVSLMVISMVTSICYFLLHDTAKSQLHELNQLLNLDSQISTELDLKAYTKNCIQISTWINKVEAGQTLLTTQYKLNAYKESLLLRIEELEHHKYQERLIFATASSFYTGGNIDRNTFHVNALLNRKAGTFYVSYRNLNASEEIKNFCFLSFAMFETGLVDLSDFIKCIPGVVQSVIGKNDLLEIINEQLEILKIKPISFTNEVDKTHIDVFILQLEDVISHPTVQLVIASDNTTKAYKIFDAIFTAIYLEKVVKHKDISFNTLPGIKCGQPICEVLEVLRFIESKLLIANEHVNQDFLLIVEDTTTNLKNLIIGINTVLEEINKILNKVDCSFYKNSFKYIKYNSAKLISLHFYLAGLCCIIIIISISSAVIFYLDKSNYGEDKSFRSI